LLGRGSSARGDRDRQGHRNGYQSTSVKTTAGEVELQRSKVGTTLERFSWRLLGAG
jgi:transposase-like protein